jgi:hypothetical protein
MFRPELRSPVARAVAPILGGILFFAALFGVTWLMAFVVGNVEDIAEAVKTDGPILYPDLRDATGKRSIVIEHNGEDPAKGWQVYYAYPADRDESCLVTQIARTHTFTDCEGRTLAVEELMAPLDVRPIVENKTTLLIDLRGN